MTQPKAFFSIDSDGWCEQARKVPSPHHNERASVDDISLLVVHGISLPPGEFGGPWIDDLFLGRLDPTAHPYFASIHQLRVSAHCLIRRDGELVQYVPFGARAWHSGISSWEGREACNDFSIGIELEGTDEQPYSDAQYEVLSGLSRTISRHYPAITAQRIVGHCDIAPGRKTDPGDSFEWQRYRQMLNFK
ncbi:N-acetyl-anhydromuranmyl-L-alanine amidase [Aeromonas salmonicida subsp. salmonicida]|uniref:1,6-anhydro-N-acetylmuramyl-L-alanine amidase AmpD n=2 Tax=Aeromonas salmonicida subsp. salmonicida TaxID=29491 RepID=A4SI74_AERS4|nr:1,6-anhydro-N-acetylmuramyl-L-alanine amidase AmpD [Aeromonas salmonicida]ABO88596.1 N-acetyl-anhydromuramyl-L-alanine amidase [Aeromonas salmonicida subsp. salmonicida A449]ASI21957.1 N-acetylmuramoyl-L-alanine amidase [Aeromonas salmonicida]ASI26273.1 N-acetylmuramoyl-L-alanine amidase [Aeromonas salmonicida]ASI30391.1 N-acetylmuramoyl-L-alanine amidase [Aeromonas salmonicida]AYO61753.1 1,6-anhydro-N-acetylmuramyl-L-alanine amidase AmpD [Aeromonas salmonicida subsp. salmonicida 01-B526]